MSETFRVWCVELELSVIDSLRRCDAFWCAVIYRRSEILAAVVYIEDCLAYTTSTHYAKENEIKRLESCKNSC